MRCGRGTRPDEDRAGIQEVRAAAVQPVAPHRIGPGIEIITPVAASLDNDDPVGNRNANSVVVRRIRLDRKQRCSDLHLDQHDVGTRRCRHRGHQRICNVEPARRGVPM